MSDVPRTIEAFSGPPRSLVAGVCGSNITLSRPNSRELGGDVLLSAEADDAFALIYQLSDMASHDFWADGRHARISAAPRSSFRIVDLHAQAQAQLGPSFDSFNVHIPRLALVALAETSEAPVIDHIALPKDHAGSDRVLQGLEQSFLYLLEQPEAHHRLVQEHLALTLLSHIAVSYGGMAARTVARTGGLAPWQVQRAKEALGDDLDRDVSLAELANSCGLSPSHFSRAFKVSTGLSPFAWLQRHRLERAKDMLRCGHGALADIALRCGFADQSHFSRMFVRHAGTSPGAWQRAHRTGHTLLKQQ